jgi:YgiT-type zinc finger domain-containing protein
MMNGRNARFGRVKHRCTNCDAEARLVTANYPFKESGLSNLVLKDIPIIKCDECGNSDPIIAEPKALMRELARAIVGKPFGLTGEEIRFLRKYLEMSQDTFAGYLHSDKAVLSRWENDHEPVGSRSDLLIRALAVILGEGLKEDREKAVNNFPKIEDGPRKVRWELDPEHLTVALAV